MNNAQNTPSCLICCSNQQDSIAIGSLFLNNGYGYKIYNNPNDVIQLFETDRKVINKFQFFVIGLDFANEEGIKLIDYLNSLYFSNQNSHNQLPIIICIAIFFTKEKIQQLQSKHVARFFIRPIIKSRIEYDLSLLFYKHRFILPPKSDLRIEPKEEELMRGNCKYYDGRHISVKIVDISLKGVHILCYDDALLQDMQSEEHDFLEHFIFEADNSVIDTDARILFTSDQDIFVEFTHFYGDSRSYLINYIKARL